MFKQVCELIGTTRTTTTPYHPQSNGQVERANQTLQNMLKSICTETKRDWADVAGLTADVYRVAQHDMTGYTPNRMLFGRENAISLDVIYGQADRPMACCTDYVEWLSGTLNYTHEEARRHMATKLRTQKSYYDRRIKARTFAVGDQVLWLRPRVKKLENVWQGPYNVRNRILERNYYTIEREGTGVSRRATAKQLRAYYSSDVTVVMAPEHRETKTDSLVSEPDCDELTTNELPKTTYGANQTAPPGYEQLRSFSSDEDDSMLIQETEKRHRRKPDHYGEWIQQVR
eukprot:GHVT01035143.1.p1 GENE.GHVT01035143.1~~GHVT01035143.1.p1  ORF type:complete len:287 (+),score=9.42 GHVT01035143.1:811-1671(+)